MTYSIFEFRISSFDFPVSITRSEVVNEHPDSRYETGTGLMLYLDDNVPICAR